MIVMTSDEIKDFTTRQFHDKAMGLVQSANVAHHRGEIKRFQMLLLSALEFETKAAESVPLSEGSEPTRSILYRSAASLALQCGQCKMARQLIGHGLSGFPPEKIEKELLELLDKIKGVIICQPNSQS